jgi:lysophospholipase L1-like esterase
VAMRRISLLVSLLATVLTAFVVTGPAASAATLPTSMAAVGDSITRGYDATLFGCFLSDCPQYSWSTGTSTSVASQYRQLRAKGASTLVAANYARTGAKVGELATQMTNAKSAQYVTVLIGANDLCTSTVAGMTSVIDFQVGVQAGLAAYFAGKGPTEGQVFVSSIPDLNKLWQLGQTISGAQNTWTTFGICQSMLSTKGTTAERAANRALVVQREIAFNGILRDACAAYSGRCLYDNDETYKTTFVRSDISSLDYFHPSVAGQNKLAGVTWAVAKGQWGL